MEAINAFLITIAIVGGILSPIILIAIIGAFGTAMTAFAKRLELKVEAMKKQPPFDDVELNLNPMTKVLTGRIRKQDEVIWSGYVRQVEIEK